MANKKIFLSALLKKQAKNKQANSLQIKAGQAKSKHAHITITVPKNTCIKVIDDLWASTQKLVFIVQEQGTLYYELKVTKKTGSDINRTITVKLVGAQAQAHITGTFYSTKNNIFTFNTTQNHEAPETQSTVSVKSVITDTAKLICHSLIRINKEAHNAIAIQLSKSLLLGEKARCVCQPALEVLAHDVQCRHGAAISTLDAKQLFYLQSHGLSPLQAKNKLIKAFLNPESNS